MLWLVEMKSNYKLGNMLQVSKMATSLSSQNSSVSQRPTERLPPPPRTLSGPSTPSSIKWRPRRPTDEFFPLSGWRLLLRIFGGSDLDDRLRAFLSKNEDRFRRNQIILRPLNTWTLSAGLQTSLTCPVGNNNATRSQSHPLRIWPSSSASGFLILKGEERKNTSVSRGAVQLIPDWQSFALCIQPPNPGYLKNREAISNGRENSNGQAQVRETAEALLPQEPPAPRDRPCQGSCWQSVTFGVKRSVSMDRRRPVKQMPCQEKYT